MKNLTSGPRGIALAGAFVALLALPLLSAEPADARGRHGHRGFGAVTVRAPIGFGFGFGYHPYAYGLGWAHPAYAYGPPIYARTEGGINKQFARLQGWGAIDLNVKPKKAEVWVDGEYVGTVGEFDGYPAYLWLEEGEHTITIYRGGYESWERNVAIRPGAVIKVKHKLGKGGSTPPPGDR